MPEIAFEYARANAWLARGLETYIEDALTADRWTAWTLAEPSVTDARLQHFAEGGALCVEGGLVPKLACEIADAMAGQPSSVWLLPDPMDKPDDPYLRTTTIQYVAVDDAVYFLETRRDVERLSVAWREAGSAAGQIGLVTTEDISAGTPTRERLRHAAAGPTLIVLSAYDGDGVLLFEPR